MDDAGVTYPDAFFCPAEDRCGAACCGAGEECVEGSVCLPACETLRCGDAHACCPAGDLCIADACTTPGDACTEALDCPDGSFCDATLSRCLPSGPTRCEYFPPPGVFTPEEQWAWSGSAVEPDSVHVIVAPVVGDLDGDGVPDVAFHTYKTVGSYAAPGVLRVVRGDTGEEIVNITSPGICPMFGLALGDLDGDGVPEIISGTAPCGSGRIVAFHVDGSVVWQSTNADGTPWTGNVSYGAPSIADLDGDGLAEVVVDATVFEHDGRLRFQGRPIPAGSVTAVYDVDDDPEFEIVAGNAVWNHDGTLLWQNDTLQDGFVAVADFFEDGELDVVVVHTGNVSIRSARDGRVLWGPIVQPGGGRGGPPTVADFDGDGRPEIGVAGARAYVVFDPDGPIPVLWQRVTQDASSNVTGSSVFDFDGDGSAEVVYNDECFMRVYSGADGTVLAEVPQNSHTIIEYPIIVDVDGDGNAEIVFAGNSAVNSCGMGSSYPGLRSGIRVFRDAADNWVGTRPVWNQHTYHVTNVRQDLSIPRREIPNWTRFNTFRQNSQTFDAPDLSPGDVSSDGGGCPGTLTLRATIRNAGAVTVAAGLPVTFYAGTPAAPGRALATVRTTASIPPGGSTTVSASFTPTESEHGASMPFFVRADDAGEGSGEHNECVEDNNVLEGTYECGSVG